MAMPAHATQPPEDLYRTIRLIRRFEECAIDLVRSGDLFGIHPCIGQEAVAAGMAAALRPDDIMFGTHRGHGHMLARGCDPGRLLAELAIRETGINHGRGGSLHPSDMGIGMYGSTGTVGHGAPTAVGAAWALAKAGTDRVAVSIFGDGAVNQGALLESLNLAALWRVPMIFVCENNLFATTLRVQAGTAGTIIGRAEAFGIPAGTHDGMDPLVVAEATAAAAARARDGGGPVFLEFLAYRFEGHHTYELSAGLHYRSPQEVERWRERDPLEIQGGRIPAGRRSQIDAEVEKVIDDARQFALSSPEPDPDGGFDYLYSAALPLRPGAAI
jgi:acetoin:2,6-dichlorophenolindophenol oxidoreductase subunit alpha